MNIMKTFFLLTVLTMLLVWAGGVMGGPRGAQFAFFFALILNVSSLWFSDRIVLKMYRAREVSQAEAPEVYNLVRELALEAKIPMPRVFVAPMTQANAFATGRSPQHAAVCVTKGIMDILNREELKGVLAHELSHIKHRDTLIMTVAATLAGAITMMASMARWAALFGGYGRGSRRDSGNLFGLLAMAILAPIAALLVQLAISRSREYAADKRAAGLAHDPNGLADALAKLHSAAKARPMPGSPATAHLFIVNPLRRNLMANLFSTHPPMEERVRRLRGM